MHFIGLQNYKELMSDNLWWDSIWHAGYITLIALTFQNVLAFALALACDLRILSSNAFLTTAFAKVGLAGDYGGTYFLTQLVGAAKARELYFLSDRVSAEDALRLGLANWVVPPEELAAKTREIALRLAQGPQVCFRYMKENLNRAMAGDVDDCLDLEATHHVHSASTADHREAAQAFVEKRQPVFQGR